MCLMKGAFVAKRNFDIIKMHSTTIKFVCKNSFFCSWKGR
jgi:hypothetical protein